jgi:type IX secretion system PorP/SprF family membrane protein
VNNRLTIHAGFQASYVYRFLQRGALVLPDQLTGGSGVPAETIGDMSKGYPDFGIGFVALSRVAYGGISMHHLARPNLSFSGDEGYSLPRKFTAHGGMYFFLYEKRLGREALKLNPSFVYLHQAGFRQINYGLDIFYKQINAGVWLRHSLDFKVNAFVLHLGYEHDYFRFGYSHDFNVSGTWTNMPNMGAHELTFLLKLTYERGPRDRFRTIKSPKI